MIATGSPGGVLPDPTRLAQPPAVPGRRRPRTHPPHRRELVDQRIAPQKKLPPGSEGWTGRNGARRPGPHASGLADRPPGGGPRPRRCSGGAGPPPGLVPVPVHGQRRRGAAPPSGLLLEPRASHEDREELPPPLASVERRHRSGIAPLRRRAKSRRCTPAGFRPAADGLGARWTRQRPPSRVGSTSGAGRSRSFAHSARSARGSPAAAAHSAARGARGRCFAASRARSRMVTSPGARTQAGGRPAVAPAFATPSSTKGRAGGVELAECGVEGGRGGSRPGGGEPVTSLVLSSGSGSGPGGSGTPWASSPPAASGPGAGARREGLPLSRRFRTS
jgi:hypothetical protein